MISLQQRQRKGIALGRDVHLFCTRSIMPAGVGGAVGTPVQNFYRLDLEEGNSSFDQRHNLTGNWLIELPFGPNREFLNKGGLYRQSTGWVLGLAATFTFASGQLS